MTWPYYVLTFCTVGFMSVLTLVIVWTTAALIRDKAGLFSVAERVLMGTIGILLILIMAGGGTALTYLMLHTCEVAQC